MKKNFIAAQVTNTVVLGEVCPEVPAATDDFIADLTQRLSTDDLQLPSLPEVALRIRNALADGTVSAEEVVHLVGSEPVLAARLLQAANSKLFYRGDQPISDLSTAVSRLGYRMVRNVSISLAAQQVFIGYTVRGLRPYLERIWKHSIRVAEIAHRLAEQDPSIDPDEAFLAGLLHDIGKLYILMRVEDYPQLFESESEFQNVITELAPDIGCAILKAWGISDELTDAVRNHETCDLESIDPSCLTAIVAVANFLANTLESEPLDGDFFEDLPAFNLLGLDTTTLAWVICSSEEETRTLHQAFLA